ncbi:MAG TPA: nucleoside phosphorylase [Victivallales bacterium]|nr:nucleoside phosphorylase [Victivallales bacterium]
MVFHPEHMNATPEDFEGNNGIGRYILLPGSDGRAKQIAENFEDVTVKEHSRRHNIYKGILKTEKGNIDIASVSSGMGTPSLDIIVNELFRLGAKRFLRVGTAGLLQPTYMNAGDFAIATGAVRDDGASTAYVSPEFPAIASFDVIHAAKQAAINLGMNKRVHTGIVHSKASLYAREFKTGPLADLNIKYMQQLTDAGVIASEMEASMLFVLASVFNHQIALKLGRPPRIKEKVRAGAICVILGEGDDFGTQVRLNKITEEVVELSLETIKILAHREFDL